MKNLFLSYKTLETGRYPPTFLTTQGKAKSEQCPELHKCDMNITFVQDGCQVWKLTFLCVETHHYVHSLVTSFTAEPCVWWFVLTHL